MTMKKLTLLFAAFAFLVGCGNNQNNTPAEPQQEAFTVETYDVFGDHLLATEGEGAGAYEVRASYQCEIDIPVTDNQALYDSICCWFAQNFGSSYDGDPRDVKAMVAFYKGWALDIEEGQDLEGYDLSYTIKMEEATDRYVTYSFGSYFEATHSPRGNFEKTHATFDRNTGQRFTRQMVKADENLAQLVMNELLEQYFSDWNDEALPELLYFDPEEPEESGFWLPQFNDPWIENDLIYFGYGPQEIAQYCAGQPQCGLPYDVMKPYLTEEGKAFFEAGIEE